jgi:transposase
MTSHTPISKISRLEVIATGARRRWTLGEKQRIIAESYGGARIVSATARRHGLSASQLFTWRRMAREGRLVLDDGKMAFSQAVIACELSASGQPPFPERFESAENPPSSSSPTLAQGRMEIVLADDRRVIVDKDVDAAALARVIGALERR